MINGSTRNNSGRLPRWATLLLLAAAVCLLFANTLPNGLTLDDSAIIGDNPLVRQLNPLRYLTAGWWSGQQAGYGDQLYRPLTMFSFGLQYALHGVSPLGYHLVNLLLYALCLPLVHQLLRRLTGCGTGAFWGSLVFALHAVHSEAVANVVGRAELLAFLFGMTALWLHARDYRLARWGRAVGLPLALACFFCAAASKESALAWLPVLVLWDLATTRPDQGPGPRVTANIPRSYVWYLLPAAAYLLLRLSALTAVSTVASPGAVYYPVNPLAYAETAIRVITGLKLLFYQVLLLLFPFRLCSDYSFETISLVRTWYDPLFLMALAGHALLIGGAILAWRRCRPLFFAVAFFYCTALITSNIPLAIGTIFGERLLFTPSFALAAAAAWLLRRRHAMEGEDDTPAPLDRRRVHVLGLAVLWLTASAVTAMSRGPQWRDNRTLFLHDVERQPKSVVLNLRAAEIRMDDGDTAEAERLLLRSLEILPDDPVVLNNLGELYRLTGRHREADQRLQQALRAAAAPRWASAPRNRALPCYNLGLLRIAQERHLEAIFWLSKATYLDPSDSGILDSLLQAALAGRLETRFQTWVKRAEDRFPGQPAWRYYQGLFELHFRNNSGAAETHLAAALAAGPEDIRFHIAMADLKAQTGRFTESAALYRRILERFQLQPGQAAEIQNRLRILESGVQRN
jgi:Tfp pilus assembly protein PilF